MFVLLQEQNVYVEASFKATSPGRLAAKQAVNVTGTAVLAEGWIWHQLHDAPTLWIPERSQDGADVRLRWDGADDAPMPPELQSTERKMGQMQPVIGTINTDFTIVRMGPTRTATQADFVLNNGDQVTVTGYAVDPNAGETFELRYQLEKDGVLYWTPGKFVSFANAKLRKMLPYRGEDIRLSATQLLDTIGITVGARGDVSEADYISLVELSANYQIKFTGTWTKDQIIAARKMLEDMEDHGLYLGTHKGGKWSFEDVSKVNAAMLALADGMGAVIQGMYGVADKKLAFRVMFAPVRIDRNPTNNVNPNPARGTWWALNSNGYEIRLSNKVFYEGTSRTGVNPRFPFTSVELIAHELAHIINWRYSLQDDSGKTVALETYYPKVATGTVTLPGVGATTFRTLNDGYVIAPRSSDGRFETVTDAVLALCMNRFADNDLGKARRVQVLDMVQRTVRFRVDKFGGYANLKDAMRTRFGERLVTNMAPGLGLIASLDDDLKTLRGD
jgi:hypothetical protein